MDMNPDNPVQLGMMTIMTTANECDLSRPREAELANYLNALVERLRTKTNTIELLKEMTLGFNAIIATLDNSAEWRITMSNMADMLFNGINTALVEAGEPSLKKAQFGDPLPDELIIAEIDTSSPLSQAKNPSTSPELLSSLASNPDWEIRAAVASNPSTTEVVLRALASDSDEGVRSYTARNPNTPEDLFLVLAEDSSEYVRDYLAQNPSISIQIMEMLSNDSHWMPRSSIAENVNTPSHIIQQLRNDSDDRVRQMAFNNPNGDTAAPAKTSSDVMAAFGRWRTFQLENLFRGSLLTMGIIENKPDLVEQGLNQGENPNQRYSYEEDNDSITIPNPVHTITPIVQAAVINSLPITKLLVEHDADVNMCQRNGQSALAVAANQGNIEVVSYLLEHGADPNLQKPFGTPLAMADGAKVMKVLLESDADPNIPDSDGDLPIIGSIDTRNIDEIKLLIEYGTDMNHANKLGETPLDRANKRGIGQVVQELINNNNSSSKQSGSAEKRPSGFLKNLFGKK